MGGWIWSSSEHAMVQSELDLELRKAGADEPRSDSGLQTEEAVDV